jgi:hypothetical protein
VAAALASYFLIERPFLALRQRSEMLGAGLEPARLATQDPKSCASTNSATRAKGPLGS